MDSEKSEVLVGRIAGAYGIKGWLKVSSYTRPLHNILDYTPWQLRDKRRSLAVELLEGKPHGKGLIVRFAGTDDRDGADALKGMDIVHLCSRDEWQP